MTVIEPASGTRDAVAVHGSEVHHAAELARLFVPCFHGDETGHEGCSSQVHEWFVYQADIRLEYIDQDMGRAAFRLYQLSMQPPHKRNLQHA